MFTLIVWDILKYMHAESKGNSFVSLLEWGTCLQLKLPFDLIKTNIEPLCQLPILFLSCNRKLVWSRLQFILATQAFKNGIICGRHTSIHVHMQWVYVCVSGEIVGKCSCIACYCLCSIILSFLFLFLFSFFPLTFTNTHVCFLFICLP